MTREAKYSVVVETRTNLSVHAAKIADITSVSMGTISGKVDDYKYHMACILCSDFGECYVYVATVCTFS